jgi:anthraniloyl-CoA monooxygenase
MDEESYGGITSTFQFWDTVDIVHKGEHIAVGGNAFAGLGRKEMLDILTERARNLGVAVHFDSEVTDFEAYRDCDLLVAADGINSWVRDAYVDSFQPDIRVMRNKFIWLGTHQLLQGLYLIFRENEHGLFIAHAYRFNEDTSTFIVECSEETWANAGLDAMSVEEGMRYLEDVFADDLQGNELLSNNSAWINFRHVTNGSWVHENVVILGDAAHTAHFSIGSGTKLALEDAIALAEVYEDGTTVADWLDRYLAARKPKVDALQETALISLDMFERADEYTHLDPIPFTFTFMTRSDRVDYDNLKMRDPEFIARYDEYLAAHSE